MTDRFLTLIPFAPGSDDEKMRLRTTAIPSDHPCFDDSQLFMITFGGTACRKCGREFVTVGHSMFHPDTPAHRAALADLERA